MKFRLLRADEIDCRIATCTEKGASILLYKDARCDMNILDETVGSANWMRHHSRDNANCTVSIWDDSKQMWIEKEDTGTESNTEKEKGLASDSFKRACFNWGIGRELYTAPFIWVSASDLKTLKPKGTGKYGCNDSFSVTDIAYKDGKIASLTIHNNSTKKDVFSMGRKTHQVATDVLDDKISDFDAANIKKMLELTGSDVKKFLAYFKVKCVEDLTTGQLEEANTLLTRKAK